MTFVHPDTLASYWTATELEVNLVVFMNLVGALLLGMLVGYERAYQGRAAGMRTYGLVCMASCALTVICGYSGYWFGDLGTKGSVDPTRVIQGIVTGIGFLGAGVIMRDGFSISGLTTSASIWAASAIGILVGVGFYASAILLAVISALSMYWVSRLEFWLPTRTSVIISMKFRQGFAPREEVLQRVAYERGYLVPLSSLAVSFENGAHEWRFNAVSQRKGFATVAELSHELARFEGVDKFSVQTARN